MFNNQRYVTKGVCNNIPPLLQIVIWKMITKMPVDKDYLQVFSLSESGGKQRIVHSQEVPEYRKVYDVNLDTIVNGKIFVIDDETYSTMLLAEEY